jgi:phosphate transport system substrate-binding protein
MFGHRKISRRASIAASVAAASAVVLYQYMALAATQLTGAGSTFVYPFFSKAFYTYSEKHPDVSVNYQSIGSGGGIQQFIAKTVDFGASDVPMNADELNRAEGAVVQIPVALGGEAITYNLPSLKSAITLSRDSVVDIFLGKIAKWNDPQLAKLNPGATLPDMPIVVVHRSDGSGTTYIFTDFLSSVSAEWKSKVGTAKSVQWPAQNSVGGKGNEGVAGQVQQTPGAIGYVELAYVLENHMAQAQLINASGAALICSPQTVGVAAATKPEISATDFSIVDRKSKGAWPISGYAWAMLYAEPSDKARARLTHDVLEWTVTDGQAIASGLDYVPLPVTVQATAKRALAEIKL